MRKIVLLYAKLLIQDYRFLCSTNWKLTTHISVLVMKDRQNVIWEIPIGYL